MVVHYPGHLSVDGIRPALYIYFSWTLDMNHQSVADLGGGVEGARPPFQSLKL